jgi:uroporphyrinogen III methyltransferase / synthase
VILMGMGRLAAISAALVAGGRPTDQPASAVQWGTTTRQRHVHATLGTLAARVEEEGLGNPAVVVVGDVAGLADQIDWRTGRSLHGRSVVVTRARAQASDLARELSLRGAEVIELPVIRISPLAPSPALDTVIDRIANYRVVVVTSVNGVEVLMGHLAARGHDARVFDRDALFVAIGPATATRLAAHGIRAGCVPDQFVAEGILRALEGHDLNGVSTLVARARGARTVLIDGLIAQGALVEELELYEAVPEVADPEQIARAVAADYVTFTASSTVRHFVEMLGDAGVRQFAGRTISIGPVTSDTMRELGLRVDAQADPHTIPGVIAALQEDATTKAS